MFRKVALFSLAAVTAAGLFCGTADASAARVKGKFKPENSGSPVLGSTKVKPMDGGVWRVGTTLQHVWRTDYKVWVDSYVDANANLTVDEGEQSGSVWFDDCDLSDPSKKGHAGCTAEAHVDGVPYAVRLVPSQAGGDVPTAIAYVKK